MDNDKFSLLISVLDKLEEGCIGHSGLEDAIIKIINYFGYSLTKEQKEELSKEFIHYEKAKLEREFIRLEREVI
ncbi:MAG: hypothetical protein NT129_02485 [Candidatus Aenigmarchaeota archaeon]|nr:hypothetical protein [Candidatus Aenigmarchaeota archaeon]